MIASYLVTTKHPTGFQDGAHAVTVKLNLGKTYPNGMATTNTRNCMSQMYGYSRDYAVSTDEEAIRMFLREHATEVVSIKLYHD